MMILFSANVFAVFSLLFRLQDSNGFSTVNKPLSLGRRSNNKADLFSSSFRALSQTTTPVNEGGSVFLQRNKDYNVRRRLSKLASKEEGEESVEEVVDAAASAVVAAVDKKLAGRKKRLIMGYQLSSMAYLAASIFNLYAWGYTMRANSLYYVFGGGTFSMAVILYILKGAASHDRLGSVTYKRLNLAVIMHSVFNQLLPTGIVGWKATLVFKVPALLALVNGIKGLGYGCLGWDKSKDMSTVLTDFTEGIQSNLKGMTVIKAKSAGYMFGTLMMGSLYCFKAKEILDMLFFPSPEIPTTYFLIVTRLLRLARLKLMTTTMYTLKDASDRDRLSGTTFVQLNFMAAAAFASMAYYSLFGLGSAISSISLGSLGSASSIVALLASGLSAMALFNGATNMKAAKKQ